MEILVKVGHSRYSIDPLHERTARDGDPLCVRPDGHKWGGAERRHHCVLILPVEYDTFKGISESSKLQSQRFETYVRNDGKYLWEVSEGNRLDFAEDYYRPFFFDFKVLLDAGFITQPQYEAIYDRDRNPGRIVIPRDILEVVKQSGVDNRLLEIKNQSVSEGVYYVGTDPAIVASPGSFGYDDTYSTWIGALADIDSGGLTDDLTYEQDNEVIGHTGNHNVDEPLGGYDLTFTARDGCRHDGTWGNGARIDLTSTYCRVFRINTATGTGGAVIIEKLAADIAGSSCQFAQCYALNAAYELFFRYNLVKGNVSNDNVAFFGYYFPGQLRAYDNIIYDMGGTSDTAGGIVLDNHYGTPGGYICNNTIVDCVGKGVGYRADYTAGDLTVKNNLCQNNGTDYAFPANFDTTGKNVSEDSTSPDGATYQRDVHGAFRDYANDDFRLDPNGDSADLAVLDDGEDLSGDFTDDVKGFARSTWYIGASEIPDQMLGTLWSYGKVKAFSDSGLTDDTETWSYGKSSVLLDYVPSAIIGMVGNLWRTYKAPRKEEGSVDTTGALARQFTGGRVITGGVSFSGVIDWAIDLIQRAVEGALAFAASLTRAVVFKRPQEGDLDATGTVSRAGTLSRKILGVSDLVGVIKRKGVFYRGIFGNLGVLGSEEILNGTDFTGGPPPTNWIELDAATTVTEDNGQMKVLNGDNSSAAAYQTMTGLTIGAKYRVSCDVDITSGSSDYAYVQVQGVQPNITENGTYVYYFIAASSTVSIYFRCDTTNAHYVLWDNISVKKIISFVGAVNWTLDVLHRTAAGVFVFGAGVLTRIVTFPRKQKGDLNITGLVTRSGTFGRGVLGVLTSIGVVERKGTLYRALDGEVTFSGVIGWSIGLLSRAVLGTLAFGSTLTRIVTFTRKQEGTFDSSGVVTRSATLGRIILGALTKAGIIKRKGTLHRALAGSITFAGIVDWTIGLIRRTLTGIVSFSTTFDRTVTFKRAPEGELNVAGVVTRAGTLGRVVLGTLVLSGIVKRQGTLHRFLSGSVSFSGTVKRVMGLIPRVISGAFGYTANLTRIVIFPRKITGSSSFLGVVDWAVAAWHRAISGITSFSTSLLARTVFYKRKQEGELDSVGTIRRFGTLARRILGVLTLTGLVKRKSLLRRAISAVLNWTGLIRWWPFAVYREVLELRSHINPIINLESNINPVISIRSHINPTMDIDSIMEIEEYEYGG